MRGKINSARPENGPREVLADSYQLVAFTFADQSDRRFVADHLDRGNGQQNLLADHLAQARGAAADADIDEFGERIALKFRQRQVIAGHRIITGRDEGMGIVITSGPDICPEAALSLDHFADLSA